MTRPAVVTVARYTGLLGSGILAGVAATVLVLELALRRLSGPEYVRVRQAEYTPFTWFIGALLVPTLVAVAVLALRARRERGPALRPVVWALGLLLLALLVSLVVNGPVNVQQTSWHAQAPPGDWARVRDRWQIAHAVRTVALVAAFCCLSRAVVGGPVSGRARPGRGDTPLDGDGDG